MDRKKSEKSLTRKSQPKKSIGRKSVAGKSATGKKTGRSSQHSVTPNQDQDENAEILEKLNGTPEWDTPAHLEISRFQVVKTLPQLIWKNYEEPPHAMKLANTGYSVHVTGVWCQRYHPTVTGGPLREEYAFSQLHFHWGNTAKEGSCHAIEFYRKPMEVHFVYHKKSYTSHEKAREKEDGLIVFVYIYEMSPTRSETELNSVTKYLKDVRKASEEINIEPFSISKLGKNFTTDYYLYTGLMKLECAHKIMWFICRETFTITDKEISEFRSVSGRDGEPISTLYKTTDLNQVDDRKIYVVSPRENDLDLILEVLHIPFQERYDQFAQSVKSVKSRKSIASKKSLAKKSLAKTRSIAAFAQGKQSPGKKEEA